MVDPDKKSTTVEGEQDTGHVSAAWCVSSPWSPSPWGGATHIPNFHPLHLDLTRHFLTQTRGEPPRWLQTRTH